MACLVIYLQLFCTFVSLQKYLSDITNVVIPHLYNAFRVSLRLRLLLLYLHNHHSDKMRENATAKSVVCVTGHLQRVQYEKI